MASDWFKEFVFQVVIDKKYTPAEVLKFLKKEPTNLGSDPNGHISTVKRDQLFL